MCRFPPSQSCPDFIQEYVSGNIHDLLNKQSRRRPSASEICRVFSVYCRFLKLFDSQDLSTAMITAHNPPSYKEWKELVRKQPDDHELLYSLAKQYEKRPELNAAMVLRKALIEGDAMIKYMRSTRERSDRAAIQRIRRRYLLGEKGVRKGDPKLLLSH